MKLEAKILLETGGFSFDILDLDCIMNIDGQSIAESIFTSKTYAREETAERNAKQTIAKMRKMSDRQLRTFCGYDPASHCKQPKRKFKRLLKKP